MRAAKLPASPEGPRPRRTAGGAGPRESVGRSLHPVPESGGVKPARLKPDDETLYTSGLPHGFETNRRESAADAEEDLYDGLSHFHSGEELNYDNLFDEELSPDRKEMRPEMTSEDFSIEDRTISEDVEDDREGVQAQ